MIDSTSIPFQPHTVYSKEWKGYSDFLGSYKGRYDGWLPFEEAKKIVHALKFSKKSEWIEYCRNGKPNNIPSSPKISYPEWKGWKDWLGNGNSRLGVLSFEEAKKIVHEQQIYRQQEWHEWHKKVKPHNIPRAPDKVYKNNGWQNWRDWLGTPSTYNRGNWMEFELAKEYVHSLGISGEHKWREFAVVSGKRPKNIPSNPAAVYAEVWKGWSDWLGNGFRSRDLPYLSFEEASEMGKKHNIKTVKAWVKFAHKNKELLPVYPNQYYKDKWSGWSAFLDTNKTSNRIIWSFEKAREYARSLNLQGQKEWNQWVKLPDRPPQIPTNPHRSYAKEWQGYGDWLGTGTIAAKNRTFKTFEEARKYVRLLKIKGQKEWQIYCNSGQKPDDIPSCPQRTYKGKGWINTRDWLGGK